MAEASAARAARRASSRIRTIRRAISLEIRIVRWRSHAADRQPGHFRDASAILPEWRGEGGCECGIRVVRSCRYEGGICRSLAVIVCAIPHHHGLGRDGTPAPVRMVAMASTISVAPVRARASRSGEAASAHRHGAHEAQRQATAWARSATEVNGKSPSRSSRSSDRASAICPAVAARDRRRRERCGVVNSRASG